MENSHGLPQLLCDTQRLSSIWSRLDCFSEANITSPRLQGRCVRLTVWLACSPSLLLWPVALLCEEAGWRLTSAQCCTEIPASKASKEGKDTQKVRHDRRGLTNTMSCTSNFSKTLWPWPSQALAAWCFCSISHFDTAQPRISSSIHF